MAYLQPRYGVIHWNISELLTLLCSFPLNYIIYENEIASKNGNYYIAYVIHISGVFYMYLNEPTNVQIQTIGRYVNFQSFSSLYKKKNKNKNLKKMKVDIFSFEFVINFYTFGKKLQSTAYKTSDASFSLLKK